MSSGPSEQRVDSSTLTASPQASSPVLNGPPFVRAVHDKNQFARHADRQVRAAQRRAARVAAIKRGAMVGCEGFRLLPGTAWKLSNPSPLGYIGMGMTYILYSLSLTGHWPFFAVALGMMIVLGGGTQMIVGCFCYARGTTVGYTLFMLNGAFWLSMVAITNFPDKTRRRGPPIIDQPTSYFLGVYFLLWAVVTLFMLIATMRTTLVTVCIYITQLLWFILLAVGHMATSTRIKHGAGYTGLVIGGLAMYEGYAQLFNEVFDMTLLPVVPMSAIWAYLGVTFVSPAKDE